MTDINKPTLKDLINSLFRKECANNNLERIKELIQKDVNSKLNFQRGFLAACINGNLSVVKYFIETQEIKEKLCLDTNYGTKDFSFSNYVLIESYANNQSEVVDYLLFEIKIEVSENTKSFLKLGNLDDLVNKIEKRDLFFQMGKEVQNQNEDVKKVKI